MPKRRATDEVVMAFIAQTLQFIEGREVQVRCLGTDRFATDLIKELRAQVERERRIAAEARAQALREVRDTLNEQRDLVREWPRSGKALLALNELEGRLDVLVDVLATSPPPPVSVPEPDREAFALAMA